MSGGERPSQFQLRVKAWTAVATAATFAGLLLYDWDKAVGHETIFSGIRPALKRGISALYGVDRREKSSGSDQSRRPNA